MTEKPKRKRGCLRLLLWTFGAFFVFFIIVAIFADPPVPQSPPAAVAETATATPEPPTATPEPPTATPLPTPTLSFDQQVLSTLDDPNRDGVPPATLSTTLDVINIQWPLNDNLTNNMIRNGALMEVVDMLKVIHNSNTDYALINFVGTFALVDNFGNSSEDPVLWLTLTKETMSKINWADQQFIDFVLYQRLPDVADSIKYHPALQGD